MTAEFEGMLSEDELARFTSALKSKTPELRCATEHEERIWFTQQQNPDAILKHAVGFRLTGSVDIVKLIKAVDSSVLSLKNANVRFQFSDEGDLKKFTPLEDSSYLEVLSATSEQQALIIIREHQSAYWDSEIASPLKVLIIQTQHAIVLSIIVHRVLDEACPIEQLFQNISYAYHGRDIRSLIADPSPQLFQPEQFKSEIPWLRKPEDKDVGSYTREDRPLALRYGTDVALSQIALSGQSLQTAEEILSFISVRATRWLCQLAGHSSAIMRLPKKPKVHLRFSCLALSRNDVLEIPFSLSASDEMQTGQVLSQLRSDAFAQMKNGSDKQANFYTHTAWINSSSQFFNIDGAVVERIPLATLEPRPDVEVAVGLNPDETISVELVTGQDVSGRIGPFLLERLVAFLEGGPALEGTLPNTAEHAASQIFESVPSATTAVENLLKPAVTDTTVSHILKEFREALNAPDMNADDNFFDFGGHSLIATRIIGRLLNSHGIEIHFNDLFSYPTAEKLAERATVTQHPDKTDPEESKELQQETSPLSLAQMSLWKVYAAFGFKDIFNIPFALEFLQDVDEAIFEIAFKDVLERHSGLRTLFFSKDDEVRQKVIPVKELSNYKWFWPSAENQGVDRLSEARYIFDLSKELPIRLRFLRDESSGRQVLSFLFHHIVLDEWSVNLLMDELCEAYKARASGKTPSWKTVAAPFNEFAQKQMAAGLDKTHLSYWTDILQGSQRGLPIFPESTESKDTNSEPEGGWVEIKLETDVTEGLYTTAKANSASLFNVVYAAISASLHKLGNLKELLVGTSASGRTDPVFFDTIGYFTTVVTHRVQFDGEQSVKDLICQVKNTINGSMPYTEVPIDLVEEALGMEPGRDRLFEVFIQIHAKNKLNGTLQGANGASVEFRQVDPDKHESILGLQFEVMEELINNERSIRIMMSYRSNNYTPEQVDIICSSTHETLRKISHANSSELLISAL